MGGLGTWVRERVAARRARPPPPRGCRGCGTCCELFGGHLRACRTDLDRWRAEGRDDLLRRTSPLGRLWLDPATGRTVARCPFLARDGPDAARCAIHETKPEICRAYPTLAHGRRCARGILH